MANLLAGASDRRIIGIQYNAHLIHQSDLLFIVASQVLVLGSGAGLSRKIGVDFGEQAQDVLRILRAGLGLEGSSGAHFGG